MSKPKLTNDDFCRAAKTLGCEVAAVRGVDDVESHGNGFYPDGFPVILFERHIFRKLTAGRYSKQYPQISGPAGNYGSAGQNQRNKFNLAFGLDPDAAMKSCSWGRYQIMGFNHRACGFATVGQFVDAMKESEGRQLDAFVAFVQHEHLADELRSHDWEGFAAGYNGAGYKQNKYDTKLAAAYRRFAKENINCPDETASAAPLKSASSKEQAGNDDPSVAPQDPATQTTAPPPLTNDNAAPNIAVEKEPKLGFWATLGKKITAAFTGIGGATGLTSYAQQAQTFGLSSLFWERIFYIAILGLAGWIVVETCRWFYTSWQRRKRTDTLAALNSTPVNQVVIVPAGDLAKYENDPNWVVVRRNG